MHIHTLFVRHGNIKYKDSHLRLMSMFSRQYPTTTHSCVIIDNSMPENYMSEENGVAVIGADNEMWEFSAWDHGLRMMGDRIEQYDYINLVTSAIWALPISYENIFIEPELARASGMKIAFGSLDAYQAPLSMAGMEYHSWLRTSFLLFPPPLLRELGNVRSLNIQPDFFSGNPAAPFSESANINDNLKHHILFWLTHPNSAYHSRFDLTKETLPFFEKKAAMILSEHALTLRTLALGYMLGDISSPERLQASLRQLE